jgi:hypothetical protein
MAILVQNLELVSPAIIGDTISVDSSVLPLTFASPSSCSHLKILNSSVVPVSTYITSSTQRLFKLDLPISSTEDLTLQVVGVSDLTDNPAFTTPTFVLKIFYNHTPETPIVEPPSGVRVRRGLDYCTIEWAKSTSPNLLGIRVLISNDESGILVPYRQFGDLVTRESRIDRSPLFTTVDKVEKGDIRTVTTTDVLSTSYYSQATIRSSDIEGEFYVMLSSVAFDPITNLVYESVYNGPFKCGYVDLRKALPSDFPYLQNKEEIAGRMISEILKIYPDFDLTPRSELRDLFIDPLSLEIAEMSIREWFARCSTSISALSVLDDADGDGFSDPFESSVTKQQLARAWHLDSTAIQDLLDRQFDILGERVGLTRGGAMPAITQLTVYTHIKPTTQVVIPEGTIVATIPDSETPSVQFYTVGSTTLDPSSLNSFYDSARGWWAVTVPAQCEQSGSLGNVGAQTIRQSVSGIPQGFAVTNLVAATYGQDQESNSSYAERIQDRQIVGVDSGTRKGYLNLARSVPGITEARVVASGDLEMLRDWDHERRKHVFGTVDVYVRGLAPSQEDTLIPYTYKNFSTPGDFSHYLPLTRIGGNSNTFSFDSTKVESPVASVLEIRLQSALFPTVYNLGVSRAQVSSTGKIKIDGDEQIFLVDSEDYPQPVFLNNSVLPTTNAQLLTALGVNKPSILCNLRLRSDLSLVPNFQPVLNIASIIGDSEFTGSISSSEVHLIKTQDPLLLGGSNYSSDEVKIEFTSSEVKTKTLLFLVGGPNILPIDDNIQVEILPGGSLGDILSVRSEDLTQNFTFGIDYKIIPNGPYGSYSLVRLSEAIPVAEPDDTFGKSVIVGYKKYTHREHLEFIGDEEVVLEGTLPTPLAKAGFVSNTWLPESYSDLRLVMDGYNIDPLLVSGLHAVSVPRSKRYIKVVLPGTPDKVMLEGVDFNIEVNASGRAKIKRTPTSGIGDGMLVKVSYFRTEAFTIKTLYPGFLQQVANVIEETRHAAADVVIKAMTESKVDISLSIELEESANAETVDSSIRTTITRVLDQTKQKLSQSEVIRQVKALAGVRNVEIPLVKFAKADGSYDVGRLIPSGTKWTPLDQESRIYSQLGICPAKTFITTSAVLPNRTLPSGGSKDAYVGLLYEGFSFQRTLSLVEFSKAKVPSFYIIGFSDDSVSGLGSMDEGRIILNLPNSSSAADRSMTDPSSFQFRVTYQVWGESRCKDIPLGPSEYLRPGRVVLSYNSGVA